jgi:heme-degrading monooxygenase HmoA
MEPGVLRIWRGRVALSDVDEYEEYSSATGYPHMTGIDGNRGLYMCRREDDGVAEFAAVSLWTSWDSVRAFAGDSLDEAVDLPEDARFLVGGWKAMENYDIFAATPHSGTPSVVRVWRGATRRPDGDEYEEYLRKTGFAGYAAAAGNLGTYMSRRDLGDMARFCCVTLWQSMDSVHAFAGADPERAVFYPEDDRFLVERDLTVAHYTIYIST